LLGKEAVKGGEVVSWGREGGETGFPSNPPNPLNEDNLQIIVNPLTAVYKFSLKSKDLLIFTGEGQRGFPTKEKEKHLGGKAGEDGEERKGGGGGGN
jgi:hypothetical protein